MKCAPQQSRLRASLGFGVREAQHPAVSWTPSRAQKKWAAGVKSAGSARGQRHCLSRDGCLLGLPHLPHGILSLRSWAQDRRLAHSRPRSHTSALCSSHQLCFYSDLCHPYASLSPFPVSPPSSDAVSLGISHPAWLATASRGPSSAPVSASLPSTLTSDTASSQKPGVSAPWPVCPPVPRAPNQQIPDSALLPQPRVLTRHGCSRCRSQTVSRTGREPFLPS